MAGSEDGRRWGRRKGGGIFGNGGIDGWIGDACGANEGVDPGEGDVDVVVASATGVGSWELEDIAAADVVDGALEVVGDVGGRGEEQQAAGELAELVEGVLGTQHEMKAAGMGKGIGPGIESEEGDAAGGSVAPEVIPTHVAPVVAAVGEDEEDAASGKVGEGFGGGADCVPEMEGVCAVGVGLRGAVKAGEGDGCVEGMGDAIAVAGGDVVCCADEEAVDGIDGDAIVGLERLVGEGQDGVAEGGLQGEGVATEVEEDGEVDGVVAFEPNVGGVKARAGVERDVELAGVDGWEGR